MRWPFFLVSCAGGGVVLIAIILFVTFFASPKKVTKERRKNGERLRRRFIGMLIRRWCYCGEGHWGLCWGEFVVWVHSSQVDDCIYVVVIILF
ncbi:hypothetical protein LX64_00381 [Chitinophaga skermanii]|uniref:Transmembrane protein n=1 Tax=Chitinophaga skermanii TaxID=331697 RepID=A0A327R4T7_9BACT|nr:hypothetical protein [Chitinophaga skermanii]RAJ10774.1 hypothetical protein LX64_00381 [Chitinophaga skermanii]